MVYICNFVATFGITWLCYGAKLIDLSVQPGRHRSRSHCPSTPASITTLTINLSSKSTYFSKIPSWACLHCRRSPNALLPFGLTCSLTVLRDEAEWTCLRWKLLSVLFHSCQAPCDIKGWILFFPTQMPGSVSDWSCQAFSAGGAPAKLFSQLPMLETRCIQPAATGPASQHLVSLNTIFTKIENSDRIYNIEFKIWGVKEENFIKLFILF